MSEDLRLAEIGCRESLQPLLDQARYTLGLAQEHAEPLAVWGLTAESTAALAGAIDILDDVRSHQVEERISAKIKTSVQNAAITEAKVLIEQVRNVVRVVLRDQPEHALKLDVLHAGGPLARVAPRISAYLDVLAARLVPLDDAMRPYFQGASATARIREVQAKLDTAAADQNIDLTALPLDTLALQTQKGQLLRYIDTVNALARAAFADRPAMRARFNKDILRRPVRAKASVEPTAP